MKFVKVGAAVLNQTPLDWDGNLQRVKTVLEQAREQQVSVLCLPEMCLSGYGCEDAFHSPSTRDLSWQALQQVIPHTQGMAVSFGLPIWFRNAIFNCVALVVNGELLGFAAKQYLAGDGIHYEPRWFKAWPDDQIVQVTIDGRDYPLGDILFDVGGVRIGLEICEEAWVAVRPGGSLARMGVDIILNPSASHFAFGKHETRERFVVEGSRAFSATYLYSNLLGNEAGRAIYDGGAMIAAGGNLLAYGPRFTYADSHLTTAVVDIDRTRVHQARTVSFRPDFSELGPTRCPRVDFDWPEARPEAAQISRPGWSQKHFKEEEFTRAITLALFDYMRKSRSRGFVVSLSGGADSAACACLVALMVKMAAHNLGDDGLARRLSYLGELSAEPVGQLLHCAYQATRNSSDTTLNAARQVAEAVKARFYNFDVDPMVVHYTQMLEKALGRELEWKTDDLALQNIQARVRSPGIWMLTNVTGALLIATSNRSEAAVGYATMDGDTSGGISPIAGIDKAFLRGWLRWLEQTGPEGFGPIPALAAVNRQAPTAELRPQEAHQTDEDDLMPYPVLDRIEKLAIRDKESPRAIFATLAQEHPQVQAEQLKIWIRRFFTLWCRNQWKRERYAPSFHVDDANLDPKTWCRFPILNGGYHKELAELDFEK